ncbi:MAG: hypothetical protein Tsb0034_07110 [Ekhidna sp.]
MQRAKFLYLTIIIICLVIISFSTYYTLGGFDPVEVYFFDGTNRTVIGNAHYIPNQGKDFRQRMDSVKAEIDAGKLKGRLTAIIYQHDSIPDDSVLCFIGASQDGSKGVMRMPAGYEYRQFKTNRIYRIFITQHPLARPNPEEIEQIMELKSIEEGEVLQPHTFELYYQDGSLSIEKWVK